MEPDGRQVSYHPNGQIASEMTYVDSRVSGRLPHGMTRSWYPNGVLAAEIPTQFGKVHGIVRNWDSDGNLKCQSTMEHGTGVWKMWNDHERAVMETAMQNGAHHGRFRMVLEDGEIFASSYWHHGRQVSQKRYLALCETDPTLPRYDNLRAAPKRRKPAPGKNPPEKSVEERSRHDGLIARLLNSRKAEARIWLRSSPDENAFTLGELPTTRQSLELAEEAYTAGAVTVLAVEINDCENGQQNSGKLVIELPKAKAKRKRIIAWVNEQAELQGFDPESDNGETHLFLPLD